MHSHDDCGRLVDKYQCYRQFFESKDSVVRDHLRQAVIDKRVTYLIILSLFFYCSLFVL